MRWRGWICIHDPAWLDHHPAITGPSKFIYHHLSCLNSLLISQSLASNYPLSKIVSHFDCSLRYLSINEDEIILSKFSRSVHICEQMLAIFIIAFALSVQKQSWSARGKRESSQMKCWSFHLCLHAVFVCPHTVCLCVRKIWNLTDLSKNHLQGGCCRRWAEKRAALRPELETQSLNRHVPAERANSFA